LLEGKFKEKMAAEEESDLDKASAKKDTKKSK